MEAQDWTATCPVALTITEVEQLTTLATQRTAVKGGGWLLFGSFVGLGLLVATISVAGHALRAEYGAVVAVAGFLACWSAVILAWQRDARARRSYRARLWERGAYTYTVTAGADGLRIDYRDSTTVLPWRGVQMVEGRADVIVLWSALGNPITIPARALPEGWSIATLTQRMAGCVSAAQSSRSP